MLKRVAKTLRVGVPVILVVLMYANRAAAQEHAPAAAEVHGVEAGAEHGAEHGEHHFELIPKMDDPGQRHDAIMSAAWVLIIFIILLMILYPTAWTKVLAGLKAREQRIRKDIEDAESTRAKAEETLKHYTIQLAEAEAKVQLMINKAVGEGEKMATNIKMTAQQEAEEVKERTMREIEAARNQAINEIYEQAAVLATNVAEKILRRNLNPDDQRDLVKRSLEQMPHIGQG